MFRSTREFDSAIQKVLMAILNGSTSIESLQEATELNDDDFTDAVVRCSDIGLATGLGYNGGQFSIFKPKVTYEGLAFIENLDTSSLR